MKVGMWIYYLIRSSCEKINEINSGKPSLYYFGKSTVEIKNITVRMKHRKYKYIPTLQS